MRSARAVLASGSPQCRMLSKLIRVSIGWLQASNFRRDSGVSIQRLQRASQLERPMRHAASVCVSFSVVLFIFPLGARQTAETINHTVVVILAFSSSLPLSGSPQQTSCSEDPLASPSSRLCDRVHMQSRRPFSEGYIAEDGITSS
ncbi:hypothetical protein C8T65DRAFT_235928 [Cerioporus squamosus]|nr:hypothetical protein C8T65DRAFT_235928 [Cerioporus squamosus]